MLEKGYTVYELSRRAEGAPGMKHIMADVTKEETLAAAVQEILKQDKNLQTDKPHMIIAHTIKGKGISFMENVPIWHYRMPNSEEMEIVKRELNISKEL